MLEFKDLQLEDKEIIEKYIKPYNFKTCEYSFTNLYIWKDSLNISYAIYKDALIIKRKDFHGNYHFMQPIGYKKEDLLHIIDVLKEEKDTSFNYLFRCLEEDFALILKDLNLDFILYEDRDNFDYIYNTKDLISLSGKKLHGKKNHYNKFIKNYEYTIDEINEENIPKCIDAAKSWCKSKGCKGYLRDELCGIIHILKSHKDIDFQGMVVYVDGFISAFTIGERINKESAIIHIEKANHEIDGLYTFINKTFVEKNYEDTLYINREQDLGIEGLRIAKLSYRPIKLEKKYKLK